MGAGSAGSVIVEAPRIALTEGAQIASSTFGPGQGGTVRVTATDTLTLAGTTPDGAPSGIFAAAEGTEVGAGSAGSVVVEAPRMALTEGAQISSEYLWPGAGGQGAGHRDRHPDPRGHSPMGASRVAFRQCPGTGAGAGSAGSVVVEAPRVALTEGAQISSSTSDPGQGGRCESRRPTP